MKNRYGVDLDEAIRNAETAGIDPSELTVFATDLTSEEERTLTAFGLIVAKTGSRVIAKLHSEGLALFPEKVSEVYCLGA